MGIFCYWIKSSDTQTVDGQTDVEVEIVILIDSGFRDTYSCVVVWKFEEKILSYQENIHFSLALEN